MENFLENSSMPGSSVSTAGVLSSNDAKLGHHFVGFDNMEKTANHSVVTAATSTSHKVLLYEPRSVHKVDTIIQL